MDLYSTVCISLAVRPSFIWNEVDFTVVDSIKKYVHWKPQHLCKPCEFRGNISVMRYYCNQSA